MPRLYDRSNGATEDELIEASYKNSWTVGDVLSLYTGQVKLFRIFEELSDSGNISVWAADCHCTEQEMRGTLMSSFDDKANLCVYGHLSGAEVRCTITLRNGFVVYLYLPVNKFNENYKRLELRVRKLEKHLVYK
jgi:hypothetical protein